MFSVLWVLLSSVLKKVSYDRLHLLCRSAEDFLLLCSQKCCCVKPLISGLLSFYNICNICISFSIYTMLS